VRRTGDVGYPLSSRREHLPRGRAAVYCANHQSNVDPPLLFTALHPRMHILYKHEIDRIPLLARAFRMGGFIPIDRRRKESAMRSIELGSESLRSGNSFLIFPEGTRSKTDDLLPFKKGGFIMAIKAGAPIVPVAVQGGREAMRKGSAIIRPVTVSVRVGQPIETAGVSLDDRDALIVRVRAAIDDSRKDQSQVNLVIGLGNLRLSVRSSGQDPRDYRMAGRAKRQRMGKLPRSLTGHFPTDPCHLEKRASDAARVDTSDRVGCEESPRRLGQERRARLRQTRCESLGSKRPILRCARPGVPHRENCNATSRRARR
jgi:1-acyl-sn-glycerol-3-phosphate acyltransferase